MNKNVILRMAQNAISTLAHLMEIFTFKIHMKSDSLI